ncbi:hypothetical protein BJX68DRAFT_271413 [Aspergillus pseudodeflectus]|uniref:Fungal N-terminal domain-containing protein n=1 Tax=Aspergillus pseudodeflectus TaxID=176178 RepID=A0ABR4JLP0_9EURO
MYLASPAIYTSLRDNFNLISGHLQEAENALNARRRMARGNSAASLSLTALWEEFIRAKYDVMTATAHSFVVLHATELQLHYAKEKASLSPDDEAAISPLRKKWETFIWIIQVADLKMWMLMDGYNGHHPLAGIVAGQHNPHLHHLTKIYQEDLMRLTFTLSDEVRKTQEASESVSGFIDCRGRLATVTAAQDQLRTVIRGSQMCPVPREPWIREVLVRQKETLERFPEERHKRGFEIAVYHNR